MIILLRIFDKDKDGFLTIRELQKIMTSMGERMSRHEFEEMIKVVDKDNNGLINCQGKIYGAQKKYPKMRKASSGNLNTNADT